MHNKVQDPSDIPEVLSEAAHRIRASVAIIRHFSERLPARSPYGGYDMAIAMESLENVAMTLEAGVGAAFERGTIQG